MPRVLVDTGVWIRLFDRRDGPRDREDVEALFDLVRAHTIVLPWPIAFETLRTRLMRNRIAASLLEREMKAPNISFLDDRDYRDEAFKMAVDSPRSGRALSMVDCLLRLVMDDRNVKIDYLATYNDADFYDVCARRRITMIPGEL